MSISTIMIHDVVSVKVTDKQHGDNGTAWYDIVIKQKTNGKRPTTL
jgi:hypothetical protein